MKAKPAYHEVDKEQITQRKLTFILFLPQTSEIFKISEVLSRGWSKGEHLAPLRCGF
jgi:hypothetical protein